MTINASASSENPENNDTVTDKTTHQHSKSSVVDRSPVPFDLRVILAQDDPSASIPLVHVSVTSASDLPHTDGLLNNIDPYVVVSYGPLSYQSDVYHGLGANPKFVQTQSGSNKERPLLFTFPYLEVEQLTLLLWDHDYCRTPDDFLGKCVINVPSNVGHARGHLNEVELVGEDGGPIARRSKRTARVCFSLWSSFGSWPAPSLKVFCHRRKVAGILKSFETGNFKWHKTFEISLLYMNNTFGGSTQHWNEGYDKAQQIFSKDSWSSSLLRGFISSMNTCLYRNSVIESTMSKLEGGKDLLSLLKDGKRKKTKQTKLYTYVVLGSSLVFSETGTGFVSDMLSKHAVHSGASTAVVYSGEFHVSKAEGSDHLVIVFDNNSGTYSPDPKSLLTLLTLLKANFPGVLFDCVDYKDPAFSQYRKRAGLISDA